MWQLAPVSCVCVIWCHALQLHHRIMWRLQRVINNGKEGQHVKHFRGTQRFKDTSYISKYVNTGVCDIISVCRQVWVSFTDQNVLKCGHVKESRDWHTRNQITRCKNSSMFTQTSKYRRGKQAAQPDRSAEELLAGAGTDTLIHAFIRCDLINDLY